MYRQANKLAFGRATASVSAAALCAATAAAVRADGDQSTKQRSGWPGKAPAPTDASGRPRVARRREATGEEVVVSVCASVNYQGPGVAPSLARNGKLGTRRSLEGSDMDLFGCDWSPTAVTVENARLRAIAPSLGVEGFQLARDDCGLTREDLTDEDTIVNFYYPMVCDLVKRAVLADTLAARVAAGEVHGAGCRVVAFDHNVRCASAHAAGKSLGSGGSAVQQPAHLVHTDYTLTGAPARLAQLSQPAKANDTWHRLVAPGQPLISREEAARVASGARRFAIVNVWRNVRNEPVQRFPLGVVEAGSVAPRDLAVFEIHYADRVGENYFLRASEHHKWAYFPRMIREEALLIKQWDSAAGFGASDRRLPLPAFCPHSAFDDPTTSPGAPDRESIEVRCIVLFDE